MDFAGFGFADCNPKIGARAPARQCSRFNALRVKPVEALAFPMFASHYPERFGQIVPGTQQLAWAA